MKRIAAISTHYAGRKFRSRVEARWAVFFDAMGIRYEYEFDGFALPGAGAYLPDFMIPSWDLFIEIKGVDPTEDERLKCAKLAEAAECVVLMAIGAPEERFQILRFDQTGDDQDVLWVIVRDRNPAAGFWLVPDDGREAERLGPERVLPIRAYGPLFSGGTEEAYALALSARFERGDRKRQRPLPTSANDECEAAA